MNEWEKLYNERNRELRKAQDRLEDMERVIVDLRRAVEVHERAETMIPRDTVRLSAKVEPTLRDYVREAAKRDGMSFSAWVARALQRDLARTSQEIAAREAAARGECSTCGYAPCMCDQQ